jgi:serine/threonine-protein kinase
MSDASQPHAPSPPLEGTLVGGRYRVQKKLGEGGMGEVYLAVDINDESMVALKVLLQSLATDPKAVARFDKEALAVSRLHHPNIVAMKDYGKSDTGQLYLAMEYLEGETVYDILAARRHFDWEQSLHVARGIAAALAEAHAQGIIHRDLKPDNVMLCKPGNQVKVLDFGLAMVAESQPQMRLTESNIIMGTPGFMSPEQIDGAGVDARSDIYALGILWWQMLVGRPPFDGDTPIKVMMQHVQAKPLAPTQARPGLVVPQAGEELVLQLLEKHPDNRPHDGSVLARDIKALDDSGWQLNTALPSIEKPLEDWEDAFNFTATESGSLPTAPAPAAAEPPPHAATPGPSLDDMIASLDNRIASESGELPTVQDEPAPWSPPPATSHAEETPGVVIRADGTLERHGAPPEQAFEPPPEPPSPFEAPTGDTGAPSPPSAMDALRDGGGLELAREPDRQKKAQPKEPSEGSKASKPSPRQRTATGMSVQSARVSGGRRGWLLLIPLAVVVAGAALWFLAPERVEALLASFRAETQDPEEDSIGIHLEAWRASLAAPKDSAASLTKAGFAALDDDTEDSRAKADELFRQALLADRQTPRAVAGLLEVALLSPVRRARASLPVDALIAELERTAPDDPFSKRARAAWALERGDVGAAMRLLRGVKDPVARAIAARARFLTDPTKALDEARVAYEASPKGRAAVHYALLSQRLGKHRSAERAIRDRLGHEPKDALARTVRAQLHLDHGDRARAVTLLLQVLDDTPDSQRAMRVLATTKRKPAEAAEVLRTIPSHPPGAEGARALALRVASLTASGSAAQALEEASAQSVRLPPSAALSYAVGDAELRSRRLARAREALETAEGLARPVDSGAAAYIARRLGDLELTRGAYDAAGSDYARSLSADPDHVAAGVGLAIARLGASNAAGAKAAIADLAQVDPFSAFRRAPPHGAPDPGPDPIYLRLLPKKGKEAKFLRGAVAFLDRDFGAAARALRGLDDDTGKLWYGAALVGQRRASAARKPLAKGESPAFQLVRARAALGTGRARTVKADLDALRSDPRYGRAAEVLIGKALRKQGRREAARGHQQAALGIDPEDLEARSGLAGL